MTLLREIQNSAVSKDESITNLLRKCMILGARLGNDEFNDWVNKELNGYINEDDLPDYRVLDVVESRGNFVGPAGSSLKNGLIPPSTIDEKWRDLINKQNLNDGIGIYEDLLERDNDSFKISWPSDLVALCADEINRNMTLLSAWKVIPRGSIKNVVDSVRNKILSFVLDIEKINPEAGEASVNSKPIPEKEVNKVFNTHIYGDVGSLASGSSDIKQNSNIIKVGDFKSLKKSLEKLGIKNEEIDILKKALKEDDEEIGEKTTSWLSKMISKAAKGGLKVSMSVASNVLPKLICNYLGIPMN